MKTKINLSDLLDEMDEVDLEKNPAILVEELCKNFDNNTALDNVSFRVREGEAFGILGANGAGKTTILNIMTTVLEKTSGRIEIFGKEVSTNEEDVRKMIGIVFQEFSLDNELSARENLEFHAKLYKVKDKEIINKLLNLMNLEEKAESPVRTFSGGMKRRLEIARGLVHQPRILFLDEPTLGLDVPTRRRLWEYIMELKKEGKMTIILTTHYMEEVEFLCDRVAIMENGRLITVDTINNLKKKYKAKNLEEVFLKVTGSKISDGETNKITVN